MGKAGLGGQAEKKRGNNHARSREDVTIGVPAFVGSLAMYVWHDNNFRDTELVLPHTREMDPPHRGI